MNIRIKSFTALLSATMLFGAVEKMSAADVTVDPLATWLGFMNVFNLPVGNYPPNLGSPAFQSSWGPSDLRATFSGATLTLSANTVNPPTGLSDAFWYNPNQTGNKIMDANMYVQTPDGTYTGQTLTFSGNVLANTLVGSLDLNGNGWTSFAFIKDFASDYSSFNTVTAPLVNGVFSISLATVNDPARHVQYGFETIGPNVWAANIAPWNIGDIQITAVPEPSTLALLGIGSMGLFALRRKK